MSESKHTNITMTATPIRQDGKPIVDEPHHRPTRTRNAGTPESSAIRRICRILDDLEEPRRVRVMGALKSIYFGPEPLA